METIALEDRLRLHELKALQVFVEWVVSFAGMTADGVAVTDCTSDAGGWAGPMAQEGLGVMATGGDAVSGADFEALVVRLVQVCPSGRWSECLLENNDGAPTHCHTVGSRGHLLEFVSRRCTSMMHVPVFFLPVRGSMHRTRMPDDYLLRSTSQTAA